MPGCVNVAEKWACEGGEKLKIHIADQPWKIGCRPDREKERVSETEEVKKSEGEREEAWEKKR